MLEHLRGQCCAPLRAVPPARLLHLVHQAAHVPLQSKAALFQARARRLGWEQSLWEGLFRALGYKHNALIAHNAYNLCKHWPDLASRTSTKT